MDNLKKLLNEFAFLFFLSCFLLLAFFLNSYAFDEPITHSCYINEQHFTFEYDTCEKVCNAVEGRFYVSVMMSPHFVNGCEIEKKAVEEKE